jgi:hypothetical protein
MRLDVQLEIVCRALGGEGGTVALDQRRQFSVAATVLQIPGRGEEMGFHCRIS